MLFPPGLNAYNAQRENNVYVPPGLNTYTNRVYTPPGLNTPQRVDPQILFTPISPHQRVDPQILSVPLTLTNILPKWDPSKVDCINRIKLSLSTLNNIIASHNKTFRLAKKFSTIDEYAIFVENLFKRFEECLSIIRFYYSLLNGSNKMPKYYMIIFDKMDDIIKEYYIYSDSLSFNILSISYQNWKNTGNISYDYLFKKYVQLSIADSIKFDNGISIFGNECFNIWTWTEERDGSPAKYVGLYNQ